MFFKKMFLKRSEAEIRAAWIKVLRIIPAVVAIYTAIHTIKMVMERYHGEWYAYLLLGGALVMEVLLAVSFELLHQNLVHSQQRHVTLLSLFFASVFCTIVVVQQNNGLHWPQDMADFVLHQLLPNSPVLGLWLVIAFFLTDHDAQLKGFEISENVLEKRIKLKVSRKRLRSLERNLLKQSVDHAAETEIAEETNDRITSAVYERFSSMFGGTGTGKPLPSPRSNKKAKAEMPSLSVGGDGQV